jgi:hypothetical protein
MIRSCAMATPYVFTLHGRRPMTFFGLAASLAFVAGGWAYGAPWFVLAPAFIGGLVSLVPIIGNPVYKMRIDRQAIEIDRNGKINRILLSALDHIKITEFSEGSDATIQLKDGTLYQIPQMTRPPTKKFREVLAEHGVAVTEG